MKKIVMFVVAALMLASCGCRNHSDSVEAVGLSVEDSTAVADTVAVSDTVAVDTLVVE